MVTNIQKFFDSMKTKKVGFIGVGVSHTDLIKLFVKKGIHITVCDKRTKEQLGDVYQELSELGVDFHLGETYLQNPGVDVLFRTPGMRYFSEELVKLHQSGVVITSELEVFFDLCPCQIFAVTGSDGKTTTTTLISELLKAQGRTVHLGGNIGRALLPIIEEIQDDDVAVVELSSFQLISMRKSPDVAVITNISPNHLDMHKDMNEYVNAKRNVYLHQNAFSKTVLNIDNDYTKSYIDEVRGEAVTFSMKQPLKNGCYLGEDNFIYMADKNGISKIMSASDIRLLGRHNIENYLAAICAVWGYVDIDVIPTVARTFGGVEHRIEFVKELDSVKWYNDSIATSPTRSIAGLNSFEQKVILIAGGYDKKIPYLPLAPKIIEKVKTLILMGATADKIEDSVTSFTGYNKNELNIIRVNSMEEAVQTADSIAVKDDVVLFSPASASFDLYKNFEERGVHFKNLVSNLKSKTSL